jgi:electron transfer flavoprotein alpha subunit
MNVWVYIDQFKGNTAPSSWEALGVARKLASESGGKVTALVFGQGIGELAQQAGGYGADSVKVCDDATLEDFRPQPYAALLAKLVAEGQPDVLLGPTTTRVRDAFGTAAVELNAGVVVDAIAIESKDGDLQVTRPVYAGKLLSTMVFCRGPQMITLRARAFPLPEEAGGSAAISGKPVLAEGDIATKWSTTSLKKARSAMAAIIVSGGRGVGGPDGFAPIRELAEVLGGAVGASRATVDAGWIPYAHQVGQTGKTVSPDLYIACGISGAIQHQAGMRREGHRRHQGYAPIFNMAVGVVGDLFEILLPHSEFKQRLENKQKSLETGGHCGPPFFLEKWVKSHMTFILTKDQVLDKGVYSI